MSFIHANVQQRRITQKQPWEKSTIGSFCNSRQTDGRGGNMVGARFVIVLGDAGLPQIRFHDLRHSCATLLLYGCSSKDRSGAVGHESNLS